MKIYLLSDLHLEFAVFSPDPEALAAADLVVLAGDIDIGADGVYWARNTFGGKPVVYVTGNHEFYGGHWTRTLNEMRAAAAQEGVHFLENDEISIDGVRFLGCALWTDFCYFGEQNLETAMRTYDRSLNDCRSIRADPQLPGPQDTAQPRRLSPQLVLQRHERSRAWLAARLQENRQSKTVVVTHHGPSEGSVAPRWAKDLNTPGFVSRLPAEMIAGADLWLHGHTHDSHDYVLEHVAGEDVRRTRVVANPRGYPRSRYSREFENPAFRPDLLVEV